MIRDMMFWKDEITLGIAIFGAVFGFTGMMLGLYNAWAARDLRRVHARVMLISAQRRNMKEPQPAFEVINLSVFPIGISEVGIVLGWRRRRQAVNPVAIEQWPQRLEARDALTVFFDVSALLAQDQRLAGVYAKLVSGEVIDGRGPELKLVRRMFGSLRKP
ncbi:hypothetical protein FV226_22960 [Methylobacterium sp. WL12]|uniref:hypothetical protein n=1 Tax=Methylobacterium sp. WL12 TaxID=2603890 RepID=UPI0011CC3ABA|nr:hypothetical protein [Methylobacterium sp. WL12]TXM66780.1 hypothetical protein FV226_22960 [Methylobacterium sp. WL12]